MKGDLDHDFNRSTKASVKSFESYRQFVILFWGPICIKNTFYAIACSIPFVLSLFWSILFEKLDCKHLRGSYLLTFLWISRADLYVTSRWPDTSDFHSPIPALVPRPKFITPSWLALWWRYDWITHKKALTSHYRKWNSTMENDYK